MSASAGHRMKQTHVLNFFQDKNNDSALTVLSNGVRFHVIVESKQLQSSTDQDSKALEEYSRLLNALSDKARHQSQGSRQLSKDPEADYAEEDQKKGQDTQDTYCICRGPDRGFMIGCDSCEEWYHGDCVGITQEEGASIDEYTCPQCEKGNRSPTAASRDSGIVLEDHDKAEDDPEDALQAWILSHLEAEVEKHAPSRSEMQVTNAHDWYHPSTHFYSLQCNDGKVTPTELEATTELENRMQDLLPAVTLPKYILNLDVPWFKASDLEVVEDSGPVPTLVRHNDDHYFLKVVDPTQPGPTKRELKIMKDIERLGLQKVIRVPQVQGLVSFTDGKTEMMGFLQTHIPGAEPLTHLLDSDVPQSKRDRWASESEEMVNTLHKHNLVWGDAKADNFMVDKDDKLWIIDFGGSYTEGWVDAELNETVEGDDMGTRKIVNALHDPDANTFDLDDTTVAEDKGVKRKHSDEADEEDVHTEKRARVD